MGEHYLVREMEEYFERETNQLRAIRSHRNRRRIWRHMIRVRRQRKTMLTILRTALLVLAIAVSKDGTVAWIMVPLIVCGIIED